MDFYLTTGHPSPEGIWYVLCMFVEGAHMIGCEDRETAEAVARVHKDRHPEHNVKVLWEPAGEF